VGCHVDNAFIVSFVVYFAILLGIGSVFYKKNASSSDFLLGGRSLNFWVTALSAHASDMSSWLFMGFPAMVYMNGMFECWTAFGLLSGMFLTWQFIAPKLRSATEQYDCLTLSSYFEKRFGDTSGILSTVSALLMLLFFTFYISSGIVGLGRLFESVFTIDYHAGIVVGVGIVTIYTLIGGFVAVAWNDMFQALFLLVMIVLVPIIAFFRVTSIEGIQLAAAAHNVSLQLLPPSKTWLDALILSLGWGLGYFGLPHVLVKYMGIDNVNDMKKAQWVGLTWQALTLGAAAFIGLVGLAYFPQPLANPELIFVKMVTSLFSPLISGFVLCAILAAAISTLDSQILVAGSSIAQDLYKRLVNQRASSDEILRATRLAIVGIAVSAVALAFNNSSTIYDLVFYAWAGLGSSFGPLVITSLYAKSINKYGALAGLCIGGLTGAVWPYFNAAIPAIIPGFCLSIATIFLVSWMTND